MRFSHSTFVDTRFVKTRPGEPVSINNKARPVKDGRARSINRSIFGDESIHDFMEKISESPRSITIPSSNQIMFDVDNYIDNILM